MFSKDFLQELRDIAEESKYHLLERLHPGEQFEQAMENILGQKETNQKSGGENNSQKD